MDFRSEMPIPNPSAFLPAVDRCKRCIRWEVDEIFMQTTCKKQDLRCQIFHLFSSVDFFGVDFLLADFDFILAISSMAEF